MIRPAARALGFLLSAPLLLGLSASCSRSPGENKPVPANPAASSPALPLPPSAEAPPTTSPVLTPEDIEEDTEHRITEQNLESELDRLEREIQAE